MIISFPTHIIGAGAITVWPVVLLSPTVRGVRRKEILRHEEKHLEQQKRWAVYGLGVGLLVWYLLYLLALPVWRNPWRERWEREAFRAGERFDDDEINRVLTQRPYYLWGLRASEEG